MKNCQNCQNYQKLSKFVKIVKTCKKCWSGHVSSSLWSNVSKSQVSRVALFLSSSKVLCESVSEWVTRSPIELFWTAKKVYMQKPLYIPHFNLIWFGWFQTQFVILITVILRSGLREGGRPKLCTQSGTTCYLEDEQLD